MRHRRGSFGLVLLAMALVSASACSNQNEGERCDKLNGNDDCESGLVCTTLSNFTSSSGSSSAGGQASQGGVLPAVCCPPQGQRVSAQVCTAAAQPPEEPVVDAGAGGASGAAGQAGAAGAAGGGGEAGQGGSAGSGGGGEGGAGGGEGGAGGSMDTGGASNLDASSEAGG